MNVSSRFDVAGFGVIVTGGASGLGLAYGEVLAAHGARVTLIDVDADAVAAQASRLQGEGLDVRGAVADVTDHATLDRAIDEAAELYGRLDVAFANAGIDSGRRLRRRLGRRRAAARRGGRARALHRRALEPRHRHQPQRDLRDGARRRPPHASPRVRKDHRDDVARGDQGRARDRLGLHGGEGRRPAPHALPRARARGVRHHGQRDRAGVLRHEHRRRPRPRPRPAGGAREGHPDAPRRSAGRHQGARPLSRVAGLGVHHRPGDRDRRRLGTGHSRTETRLVRSPKG